MPEVCTHYDCYTLSEDGSIGRPEQMAFTTGHCHSFALALNELTGWPVYGLVDERRGDFKMSPSHVVVRSPKGYVDVYGTGALAKWRKRFTQAVPMSLTPYEANHLQYYLDADVSMAMPYAQTLVNKLGPMVSRSRRNVHPNQLSLTF